MTNPVSVLHAGRIALKSAFNTAVLGDLGYAAYQVGERIYNHQDVLNTIDWNTAGTTLGLVTAASFVAALGTAKGIRKHLTPL